VSEIKQEFSERTQTLSRSLFEARRKAFILRQRTETLSRSFVLLSRLCYLLCVCFAFVLVYHFVDVCDKRWPQGKSNGHQRQTIVGNLEESQETVSLVQLPDN
jgi:hypothetical protein